MWISSSITGHYEVLGNPNEADCIIGHSFSTVTTEAGVNHALAQFALVHANGRPIIADRTLVNAFPNKDEYVAYSVEGPVASYLGAGVGTWGTLVEAKEFMQEQGFSKPMMVANARHIGRVVRQATKQGIGSIVPAGLPSGFDPDSLQRHTRSLAWWIPREVVGSIALKAQGRL